MLQAVNLDFGAFRSSLYVDDLERVMPATLVEIHRNAALQSVSVPAPMWLVLIPAVQVAVACAAVNFALTLMVEVIVFAARHRYRVPPPD